MSDASPQAYRLTKRLKLLCRCRLEGKRDTIDQVRYWEIIADNLTKPDGVEVVSQQWIPTGEQSGLLMHTAMTGSVSLCARMKS
jgi:hypothetical protein